MKSLQNYLTAVLLFITIVSYSQDFSLNWSEKQDYRNSKDGFFSGFINTNDTYIYAMNSNLALKPSKKDDKVKILAYDKSTMKLAASVCLRGYKENLANKDEYKPLEYYKTVVFNDEILVFWLKKINNKNDKKDELYVESFSSGLKRIKKLKKIYTVNLPEDIKTSRFAESTIVVMANKDAGQEIVIGNEKPRVGDNTVFKYSIINTDLEVLTENEVDLPVEMNGTKSYGKNSSYEFGKDGNIYVKSRITIELTKEERKAYRTGKKRADLSYLIFSIINPQTQEFETFELKDENINFNDISWVITDKNIRIYGFFGDLAKDPTGNSTHGLFYSVIDSKTLEGNGLNYTYFDKKTLDALFAKDAEDKKKTTALLGKKKKAQQANNDEALDTRFGIEEMFVVDENNIVLLCSKMYNYSVTTCTSTQGGGQTCTTRYYCEKSNVIAIKISTDGAIGWASNLDRKITYSGTSIYDLKAVFKNDKFYVIYGSSFEIDAEKKSRRSAKKYKDSRDNFEYAIFENSNGEFKKNTFMVNAADVEKKERKRVSPVSMAAYDGTFYVNYIVTRQQAGWCVANVLCWPTLYYSMLSGNTKKGYGNLGVISILENTGTVKGKTKGKKPTAKPADKPPVKGKK